MAEEKEEHERGEWGSHIEFLLACLGYAVGLGNVWRFPYLCFENGGGAFLIPYAISLFIAGLPVFFLELSLGQFSSLGPSCIYGKIAPFFRGLGWAMILVSAIVMFYYNIILAWILFYFFACFRKDVMWANCRNDWNTPACQSIRDKERCQSITNDTEAIFYNKTCYGTNDTLYNFANQSVAALTFNHSTKGPSDEYFHRYVLEISDGFDDMGGLSWKLSLSLLGAWLIIFLCLYKGVQGTGKVVYFTATFPYVILVILLIRGACLEGAYEGIHFYIVPDWSRLKDIKVWEAAATQIFYSLGPAFGSLITMSSYNPFKNNCQRDAIIVAIGNCLTSVFAGFAIFAVVGFMAHDLNVPVQNVTTQGPGLAFVVYPEVISRMPVSPLWGILFFFMLITLGLDSQFAMVETVTTAIFDEFPQLRPRKTIVIGIVCAVSYLLGLPMCTRGGFYLFTIIDSYAAGYSLVLLCLLEIVLTMYFYGLKNILHDFSLMIGFKPNYYWRICWFFLAPLFLLFIFVFSFIYYQRPKYGSYIFPDGAAGLGILISVSPVIVFLLFATYQTFDAIRKSGGDIKESAKYLFRPTDEWCPASERTNDTSPSSSTSQEKSFDDEKARDLAASFSFKKRMRSVYPSVDNHVRENLPAGSYTYMKTRY